TSTQRQTKSPGGAHLTSFSDQTAEVCPVQPSSWHRLGPLHLPLVAQRCRHCAVAVPIVAVGILVSTCPRQQCPQPQQRDFSYNQLIVGPCVGQPGKRRLGFGHITIVAAVQKCLDQYSGRRNAPRQQLSLTGQMVDGGAHQGYRPVAISMPSHLTRQVDIYWR